MQVRTKGFITDFPWIATRGLVLCTVAGLALFGQTAASQSSPMKDVADASTNAPSIKSICSSPSADPAKAALHLLCHEQKLAFEQHASSRTIVVGFVGGFANPKDVKHPEILFAAYLREHYGSALTAHVFSNHDQNGALQYVKEMLDINHDGILSDEEKSSARVIIYGHSWGASETVAFARALQHYSIPVLLTVQLDTVGKWGQRSSRVPSNVESAVNFYQSEGFLRGRREISAEDGSRTAIVGNFRFSYIGKPIDCSNYPWFARTFNKPHHEIENDPGVWNQVAMLIDSKISNTVSAQDVAASNVTTTRISEVVPPSGRSSDR